ncbi:htra protease/chaperone protein [hydrocarbon metagenome]|uniref:Htra protease/chaperone protein n=1 Tax=hydrocarbon metagenome TaxID=938273 RepID=A0A0W8E4V9_9ZZZZ
MKRTIAALMSVSIIAFFLGGVFAADSFDIIKTRLWPGSESTITNDKKPAYTVANSETVQLLSVADIVEQAGPAVVNIEITSTRNNPLLNDPFYRQFFGGNLRTTPQVQESIGSGFIISSDGYIITNQHVVDGAETITVTVPDQEEKYEAYLVGEDYDLDLAVIKIAGNNYPTLPLGNSEQMRVGEAVMAIGQPYGLDHTVTTGVVSAKERPISIEDRNYTNLIQTDAAINPGNSGGPLLNMQGQVIGINTAISTEAQGIGFAIPIDTVTKVLDSLLAGTKIERAFLGVSMTDVGVEAIQQLNLPAGTTGALVAEVIDGSPADKSGLLPKDVIIRLGDNRITSASDLQEAVQSKEVNDKVKIVLLRQGEQVELDVQLQAKQ